MIAYKTLAFIAIVIVSSWAEIPYDELQLNIFDSNPRNFELSVFESTSILNRFLARDDVALAISAGMVAFNATPYIEQIELIIPLLRDIMSSQSEWRALLTKAIADETMHEVTESEIHWMKSTMETIETKIKLLGDENPNLENRKTIATILHTELDRLINFFDLKSSLFRKYPLIGGPVLIQLASLIAIFSPIAQLLIPIAKNPQISCKMHDVLLDYRRRTVNARLYKFTAQKSQENQYFEETSRESIFSSLVYVMSLPFNRNGYKTIYPGKIDCERSCHQSEADVPISLCLKDSFGNKSYGVGITYYNKADLLPACVVDYASYVRHRVEDLFPVDQLNKECLNRPTQTPTGYGWLTIHLQYAYTYGELPDGYVCKYMFSSKCCPYIKLFVNGEEVLKSAARPDVNIFDADITYTTPRIANTSTIAVEIWDAPTLPFETDALILRTEGDIQSFLNKPRREGILTSYGLRNAIETISFWQDKFN